MNRQSESPKTTSDFLAVIRSEIESDLLDKTLAILEPKLKDMLYRNILDPKETAKYLKVSSATLSRLVKEKEVPFFKIRESLRFRQWELDEYISKRMIRKEAN